MPRHRKIPGHPNPNGDPTTEAQRQTFVEQLTTSEKFILYLDGSMEEYVFLREDSPEIYDQVVGLIASRSMPFRT